METGVLRMESDRVRGGRVYTFLPSHVLDHGDHQLAGGPHRVDCGLRSGLRHRISYIECYFRIIASPVEKLRSCEHTDVE
jgi:hypothetical protein